MPSSGIVFSKSINKSDSFAKRVAKCKAPKKQTIYVSKCFRKIRQLNWMWALWNFDEARATACPFFPVRFRPDSWHRFCIDLGLLQILLFYVQENPHHQNYKVASIHHPPVIITRINLPETHLMAVRKFDQLKNQGGLSLHKHFKKNSSQICLHENCTCQYFCFRTNVAQSQCSKEGYSTLTNSCARSKSYSDTYHVYNYSGDQMSSFAFLASYIAE